MSRARRLRVIPAPAAPAVAKADAESSEAGSASLGSSPRAPGLRGGALLLFAASCVPMLVMLPASLTGLLSSVGVRSEAGWVRAIADPLTPVAQPLLVVATLLLAVGALSCGRQPVAAAASGGTLLYLSMYVVTGQAGQTQPALFYVGLALFLASPVLSVARPRVRACRPLLHRRHARAALAGAVAVSVLLLSAGPALGWGRATTAAHRAHLGTPPGPAAEPSPPPRAAAPPEAPALAAPEVRVSDDAFHWSGSLQGYTAQDAWFPPISTDGARLQIRGTLRGGTVYVQLMDGRAVINYEETLTVIPKQGIALDIAGARGVWMVTLGFRDYSGDLAVELTPLV